MKTSFDIHLTTRTAHSFGAGLGMRTGRRVSPWAGSVVGAGSDGAEIFTEVAADRNLHALAARCAS